ncbi:hypothetical protein CPB84DRAFT_1844011 [Gymnopilus junonius]|uniref:Uncharacterized protein n=1 Tax=Gymnopilus junonius TaxID=109634 RepID=A0A9P5TQG5_GYMJU|nr:hypothetical protein CPB84DRAFT_1844011 [Gymnopilus junonius]
MNSTNIVRRAVASRSVARHSTILNTTRRYASTQKEEVDPQLNGYPQLPFVSRGALKPLGWDDNLTRTNFGETIHEQDEVLSMWGPDVAPIDPNVALRQFLYAVAGFVTFGLTVKYVLLPEPPAVRRTYPYDGLVKELGGLEENKARPLEQEQDE